MTTNNRANQANQANRANLTGNTKIKPSRVHLPIGAKKIIDARYKVAPRCRDFIDHYYYVAGILTWAKIIDKRYEGGNPEIPLNHAKLDRVVSQTKLMTIIKDLVNWGVIEKTKNQSYTKGISSRYRYCEELDRSKTVNVVVKDRLINKKIQAHRDSVEQDVLRAGLGDYVRSLKEITIDADRAKKYVHNHYEHGSAEFQQRMLSIDMIDKKEFFCVMDKNGRVHTNITNLARELRGFLLRDTGEEITEIDIANSQPLFLYCALKNGNIDKQEVKRYGELVASAGFYEELNGGAFASDADRSAFKEKVYKVFYGKVWNEKGKVESVFFTKFPSITRYIKEQKKVDYKMLAKLMQQMESDFIVQKCVKDMFRHNGYDFCLSIHDSLVVLKSDYDMACEIIRSNFESRYGIKIVIKEK